MFFTLHSKACSTLYTLGYVSYSIKTLFYTLFSSISKPQLRKQSVNYFTNKIYNNDFGDILPLVACNALDLRIIIMSSQMQRLCDCTIVKRNLILSAKNEHFPNIVMHLRNEHYSSAKPLYTHYRLAGKSRIMRLSMTSSTLPIDPSRRCSVHPITSSISSQCMMSTPSPQHTLSAALPQHAMSTSSLQRKPSPQYATSTSSPSPTVSTSSFHHTASMSSPPS